MLAYNVYRLKLYWYVSLPLGLYTGYLSRNFIMRNCIDRIYYPGEALYKQMRASDPEVLKQLEEKGLKKKKPEPTPEDKVKKEILRVRDKNLRAEHVIKSEFEKKPYKGVGFGKGREEMEVTGPFSATKKNRNPGPATYESISTLNRTCYSMNGKNLKEDKEKLLVPGPGSCISFSM